MTKSPCSRLALLLGLLLAVWSLAPDVGQTQTTPASGLRFSQGGVDQGRGTILDCSTGLSCTLSGSVWTMTATGSGGGAPTTSTYITQTPDTGLSAEQALSLLGTGLMLNTTGTGVVSIYAGSGACAAGDFISALTASGVKTCGTPAGSGTVTATGGALTLNALMLGAGGTDTKVLASLGTTTTVLHGNAAGVPSFAAVVSADLNITTTACTNQVVTAISGGGVGTCSTVANAMLANSAFTLNGASISLGGTRTLTLASADFVNQGTTSTVLHGNAAGNPAFGAVALGTDVSGTLLAAQFPALTGNVTTSAGSLSTTIAAGVVTNAMLANVATATFKGRTTAGSGSPEDLTVTQATALLNLFSSTLQGLVPLSGGGTTNFLRADGNWAAPAGGGNVTAGTLTTNALVLGSGATAIASLGSLGTTTTVLHGNAAGAPTFAQLAIADLSATGTPSATTFLRGDNTWSTPAGAGTVTSIATTSPITGGTITTTGTIACATCVTSAAALTNNQLVFGAGSQATAVGDLTGDVTTAGGKTTTLANIPSGTPAVGTILFTNIAAPTSPAAGKVSVYADSTDLRFHDKNASGVIGTTVVADTGASNNFLTAISAAGAISKAQPSFTNLSGSVAAGQMPALTGDVTTSAGTVGTTIANNAVTTVKILDANVTLAKIVSASAASRLLGRGSASGAGVFQEITLGTGLTMTNQVLSASGGSGDTVVVVASDVTHATSNTTLSDITGLVLTISSSATEQWEFLCTMVSNSNGAVADFKFGFTVPASATMFWSALSDQGMQLSGVPQMGTETITLSYAGLNGTTLISLRGVIFGGGTGGSVQAQFAQNASSANTTIIKKGSWCRFSKIVA